MSSGAADSISAAGVDTRSAKREAPQSCQGNSRTAKLRKRLRSSASGGGASAQTSKPSSQEHPVKAGSQFMTTREGIQIACESPCANQRAHVCQCCLQPHKNGDCPNRATKSGKGGGKAPSK
eukprot:4718250-Amphidinium_carterae.1